MNIMIANSPEGHEHDAELDGEAGEADEAEPDGGGDLHEGLVEADELRRLYGRREDRQGEEEVVVLGEVHGLV